MSHECTHSTLRDRYCFFSSVYIDKRLLRILKQRCIYKSRGGGGGVRFKEKIDTDVLISSP